MEEASPGVSAADQALAKELAITPPWKQGATQGGRRGP